MLALHFIPSCSMPDGLVQFNSFRYTFWLSYTINYSKVKSACVLNCTKINNYMITIVQVVWNSVHSEFSQFS